jgi:hypothetical protein
MLSRSILRIHNRSEADHPLRRTKSCQSAQAASLAAKRRVLDRPRAGASESSRRVMQRARRMTTKRHLSKRHFLRAPARGGRICVHATQQLPTSIARTCACVRTRRGDLLMTLSLAASRIIRIIGLAPEWNFIPAGGSIQLRIAATALTRPSTVSRCRCSFANRCGNSYG